MERITRWMASEFKPAIVNFESLTPGVLAERAGLRVPDPYEFARHCVGAYRVAEELGIRAVYSAAETERVRLSFCPVGTDALIVTPEGRVSACYLLPEDWRARGLDLDVGRLSASGRMELDFAALTRARELPADKPHCERCMAQWSCAGGCHVNHTYPGCSPEYDAFCVQTRIVTACLLLREMGEEAIVDELLANQSAMQSLALHQDDRIVLPRSAEPTDGPVCAEPAGSLVARGLTALG
jgi:radical SAM protein with 4Fe4S-binding SPASM domain